MNYTVSWTINVEADTPVEAARKALEIQRDPESIALCFDVAVGQSKDAQMIDLCEVLR